MSRVFRHMWHVRVFRHMWHVRVFRHMWHVRVFRHMWHVRVFRHMWHVRVFRHMCTYVCTCCRYDLTQKEAQDLKKASRRKKQTEAQQRYRSFAHTRPTLYRHAMRSCTTLHTRMPSHVGTSMPVVSHPLVSPC